MTERVTSEASATNESARAGDGTRSFEATTERLAVIVDELERGDIPLEQALSLFEEGIRLARDAQARIEQAERRVEELLGFDTAGRPITKELKVSAGREGAPPGGGRTP